MNGVETDLLDVMNRDGMFQEGKRLRDYHSKDTLTLSGRLIPEFNGRRNIRDMFAKRKPLESRAQEESGSAAYPLSTKNDGLVSLDLEPNSENTGGSPATSGSTIHSSVSSKASTAVQDSPKLYTGAKRVVSEASDNRVLKRAKSGSTPKAASSKDKGQQSLKGFFRPVSTSAESSQEMYPSSDPRSLSQPARVNGTQENVLTHHHSISSEGLSEALIGAYIKDLSPSIDKTTFQEHDRVHDPIDSKDSWSKLFSKPTAPRCESHDEPCKIMVTRKPGVNCGRSFWVCTKPLGPSGIKEKGTQWKCRTFIWCSDWTPMSGSEPFHE